MIELESGEVVYPITYGPIGTLIGTSMDETLLLRLIQIAEMQARVHITDQKGMESYSHGYNPDYASIIHQDPKLTVTQGKFNHNLYSVYLTENGQTADPGFLASVNRKLGEGLAVVLGRDSFHLVREFYPLFPLSRDGNLYVPLPMEPPAFRPTCYTAGRLYLARHGQEFVTAQV